MLTPERTRALVPAVLGNVNGLPVEFHTHCITGLGPLCCLEAIKLGIKSVNTAIPPLADASSNPSLFNVIKNARALGYTPTIDAEQLKAVAAHFTAVARREGLPIGVPAAYDYEQYFHQVPGGMIANLRHQLATMGLQDKLKEVLQETARVRAEFGHPIMVTPYSQFVGTQAMMNVVLGERYKAVPDEVIQYALGLWGEEESASIEPNVKDRILEKPRAKELADWSPPQPSLAQLRRQYGGPGVSDDESAAALLRGQGRGGRHARRRPVQTACRGRRSDDGLDRAAHQGKPLQLYSGEERCVVAHAGTGGGSPWLTAPATRSVDPRSPSLLVQRQSGRNPPTDRVIHSCCRYARARGAPRRAARSARPAWAVLRLLTDVEIPGRNPMLLLPITILL